MRRQFGTAPVFFLLCGPLCFAQQPAHGLRVPPGFEVTEFADAALANDAYCMTVAPDGRVVVSGRGYLRILEDPKNTGKADRALEFAHPPKDGATGLCWDGDDLFVTGDGGLRVYRGVDAGGRAKPSELLAPFKTGGEHMAHAVRRGPDGWLYVLCGDGAGVTAKHASLATSPVKDPVGGCVVRFAPDFSGSEIVCEGFRNPYAMDFNPDGELFTYDSDNERCVSLPWYEPTRLYHVVPGGHYGWLAPQRCATWRYPPSFADVKAPVATLGRGSPTGLVCYRHTQFPAKYRGGLFLADWTFGRVYFGALAKNGATYAGTPEVFLQSAGDTGFAPTAVAVHPTTGDLYVSIGGRGTRGAVYRVRYPEGVAGVKADDVAALQPKPRAVDRTFRGYREPADAGRDLPRRLSADTTPVTERLGLIRLAQRAIGDVGDPKARGTVWEGYSRRDTTRPIDKELLAAVRGHAATGDADLDRESLRFLALAEDDSPRTLSAVAERFTRESHPTDDFHALIVAARLKAERTADVTRRVAEALVRLDAKVAARKMARERNWSRHLAEVHAALAKKDPALNKAILDHPDFGRPDHALFTEAPGFDKRAAAERFAKAARADPEFAWTAALVELMGHLPPERALPLVRALWGEHGQDEAVLAVLAQHPDRRDVPRFLAGLGSPSPATLERSLDALARLSGKGDGEETLALILALRRLPEGKETARLAEKVGGRLTATTGQKHGANRDAWAAWFAGAHPDRAGKLADLDGIDVVAWKKRLAGVAWDKGDAERGRAVYTKASCAACHAGSQALGPDLAGVAGRFSRDDLFTAIVRPSKDVSERYRTTVIATEAGKVVQGIIVYEAVDSVILLTGPAQTVRLTDPQIREKRPTAVSLMPAGLLDKLADADLADLYAFLKANAGGPK